MKIFVHCLLDHVERTLFKIEWMLCDGKEVLMLDSVNVDSPSYTFDFIQFLLALGRADHIIGFDLDRKVKFIHNAMNMNDFKLTIKRVGDINRIDLHKYLPGMKKPDSVDRVFTTYFDNELLINGVII